MPRFKDIQRNVTETIEFNLKSIENRIDNEDYDRASKIIDSLGNKIVYANLWGIIDDKHCECYKDRLFKLTDLYYTKRYKKFSRGDGRKQKE